MSLEFTIVANHLNQYYGSGHLHRQILFDINLEIKPGEIVIMTGPSGSGKTTLLTLIGGLRTVQEGNLYVLGQKMAGVSSSRLKKVRRQIGFIFQDHNLLSSLNAIKNVEMAAALYPISAKKSQAKSKSALEAVGLGKYLHSYPYQLSVGQKQRVAIARALVNQPQVILADEPTASLDGQTGREIVELMQKLAKQQSCTIILVTHDNRILDIADRIISLEDGRLSTSRGELLLNLSNLTSFIADTDSEQIKNLVNQLSSTQFSEFLGKLNRELKQMVNTINLLTNRSCDLKLQTTLQVISLKIAQLLQAEQVTFFIIDRQHQILWSKNARGKDGELINIEIPIDAGIAGYVATTGETLNIPDPYNDARFNPKIDRDSGFRSRSILCLPIIDSQGEVFAVVEALNKQGNISFDKRDEERFYELTQSLEFAVQSSILYAQSLYSNISQTLGMDMTELKEKIKTLSLKGFIDFLNSLNKEFKLLISSGLTFESHEVRDKITDLFQVISYKISQVLSAEFITFFIVNREKQTLRSDCALSQEGKPCTIEVPINEGIIGYVAHTGEPIIINNPHNNECLYSKLYQDIGFQTRHIMSLPIFDPETKEVVAVVYAINKFMSDTGFDITDQQQFSELIDALGTVLQVSIIALRSSFIYTDEK